MTADRAGAPNSLLEDRIVPLFETPLIILDWPGSESLNRSLGQLIAADRAASPGVGKSNVGGWHSATDFILRDAPALAELRDRIRSVLDETISRLMAPGDYSFRLDGWANVLGPHAYNGPHNHPNATWSGVYYLTGIPGKSQPGPGELAGKIEFLDPRPAAGMLYAADNAFQRRCLFSPRPGCMLLFPSWLQHMVHPFPGPGERVSIAFNITIA